MWGMKDIRIADWVGTVSFTHGQRKAVEQSLEISNVGSSGEGENYTIRNQLLLASQALLGFRKGWDKSLITGIKKGLFVVPEECYDEGYSSEYQYDIHFRSRKSDKWGEWLPSALDEYLTGEKTLEQAAKDANVPYARLRTRINAMKNRLEKELGLKAEKRRETSWLIKALAATGRLKLTRNGEFRSTEAVC